MVRVLTVHNFASQSIHTIEQPTASTVAPPNRLLTATSSHCIEVRDLKDEANLLFSFPTVDQVVKMVHCLNGDFVATLETKCNRQNREINFVRVYINWDSIATLQQSKMTTSGASLDTSECGMVQPMRARIAGRVTPTTNQSEVSSLEMIEIPVRQNPAGVECCQITGNILIQMGKILCIYKFEVKTHDISKLKFIDFEELPVYFEISFVPSKIAMCENYVACLNKESVHVFRIERKNQKSDEEENLNHCDTNFKFIEDDEPVDFMELLKKEELNELHERVTITLPSILKSSSLIHRHSPFTYVDKEMDFRVHKNFGNDDSQTYYATNLIQLKLQRLLIKNSQSQALEEYRCLILKPLYVGEKFRKTGKNNSTTSCSLLKSNYRNCLSGIVCFITTSQEGYLFQFSDSDLDTEVDNCITMYPFMGPVYSVVLEGHLLHALTETGLESYTIRVGHKLCRTIEYIDGINSACPSIEDHVCLIGHKQFLGVEHLLLCNNHLVLFASADTSPTHSVGSSNSSTGGSPWTMYNLELPTPKMIFTDIVMAANAHRFTAPQTYCNLVSEAHMILKISVFLMKWTICEGNVCTVTTSKVNIDDIAETYLTSCALLGDHYVMQLNEHEYKLCLPYYKMACITPHEVLRRFKRVQQNRHETPIKAILYYLTKILSESKFKLPVTKADGKQNFIEELLSIFEHHNCDELPRLILKNTLLREYSTSKFIQILNLCDDRDKKKETEKLLALTLLYIQDCNITRAENAIKSISDSDTLKSLLLEYWKILFDSSRATVKHKSPLSFSEFCSLAMSTHGNLLSEIFVVLMFDRKIHLHNVLRMFLDYLPSRVGCDGNTASSVMQRTLELYFKKYFENYDEKDLPRFVKEKSCSLQEAVKILIRSYLSELQVLHIRDLSAQESGDAALSESFHEDEQTESLTNSFNSHDGNGTLFCSRNYNKNNENDYLFSKLRYEYLNKMPPFQIEITAKLYETCLENYVNKEAFIPNKKADAILQKLQALFCSRVVSNEIIDEVNAFLGVNDTLRGYSSLKSILLNVDKAVPFLLEVCPQCLPQFGKDRFTRSDEWKFLITSLQKKIITLSKNSNFNRIFFYHRKLLKDILTHLATNLPLDELKKALPCENVFLPDSNEKENILQNGIMVNNSNNELDNEILNELYNYEYYLTMCKEASQANQMKELITNTAQHLLNSLNF